MPICRPLLLFGLLLAPALVQPADAQIFATRDANGVLILSDTPIAEGMEVYKVAPRAQVATTQPLAARRATSYDDIIDQHAARHGVRSDLVRAVIQVESAFNRFARSNKGAMGLMQLMPTTARQLGVTNPYDAEQNIAGGVAYLRSLLDRFDGNEELALAAYNAGPGAVERYGQRIPPYRETRDYVRKIRHRTGALEQVAVAQRTVIYKIIDVVDGHEVARYSNVRPEGGRYEVVGAR
jgi:soluble lytic murein transglycosylase-like protein